MLRPLLVLSIMLTASLADPSAFAQSTPADRLKAIEATYPPWQRGDGSDVGDRGFEFTVPPADVLADFHGSLDNPQLVLFASGNYFFALGLMVKAFGEAHPQYRGHVFYETLPPGLLLKQMEAGGKVTSGNMTWTVKPDVYMAELAASNALLQSGRLVAPIVTFATNDLAIMVSAGNPAQISKLADLSRPGLALAMPNPAFEGVARQIRASLVKAGGEALAEAVYGKKVRDGEAVLTRIHHRQTPAFLMQHLVEAGVTWKSEAIFQEEVGNPISHVDIPPEQNTIANYSAAMVPDAPHPEAARAWLAFVTSDDAFGPTELVWGTALEFTWDRFSYNQGAVYRDATSPPCPRAGRRLLENRTAQIGRTVQGSVCRTTTGTDARAVSSRSQISIRADPLVSPYRR